MAANLNKGNISDFYNGTNIFITGATGFLGKALLEKLLRSCKGIGTIYLLIRQKKNIHPQQRLESLLENTVFNALRKNSPQVFKKVKVLEGEISQENLGLSNEIRSIILREVNIIFHLAASVRFNGDLKQTITYNVFGTKQMIQLCKEVHQLKGFVYVSTAYSNADKLHVEEIVYDPQYHPESIIDLIQALPLHTLEKITPDLIGKHPNVYTFSKGLAEKIVADNSANIPAVIVRPSIVSSTWKEPFAGWVDTYGGPTGYAMQLGLGIHGDLLVKRDICADIIPADIVVNTVISAAWHSSETRSTTAKVYNCVSGPFNRITWNTFAERTVSYMSENPTKYALGYPCCTITENRYIYLINYFLFRCTIAIIYDAILYCSKRKPMVVRFCKQTKKHQLHGQWVTFYAGEFGTTTFAKLIEATNLAKDCHEFNVDMRINHGFDWNEYLYTYALGIRRYSYKDTSDVAQTKVKLNRLYWIRKTIMVVLLLGLFYFVMITINF